MSKKLLLILPLAIILITGTGYFTYTQFFASPYNYPLVEQKFTFEEPKESEVMAMMKKETKDISSLTANNPSTAVQVEPIPERKYAQFEIGRAHV